MEFSNKAVVLKAFGSYDCLSIEKFPLPPLDGTVEVQVQFCGMNFADLYTRQGLMQDYKLPFVLGIECAGTVTKIGSIVKDCSLEVGQRVICYDFHGGLHQDVVRLSPDRCYPLPDHVSFEQAAAIFVNYLTAYFALFDLGNLKPNETVLIQSCAGGVGCAATQLAKTVPGVKVIGTASASKEEAARANGVNFVFKYEDLEAQVKHHFNEVDLIIDNQAGKTFNSIQDVLKPLGRIVLTGANSMIQNDKKLSALTLLKAWWNMKSISPSSLILNNRAVCGLHLGILARKEPAKVKAALNVIYDLLKEGKIQPKIDSVWPLDEVDAATRTLGERRNIGKVLLSVNKPEQEQS